MARKQYTPGTKAPQSAQYGISGTGKERTVVKGEPLPPTPKPGQTYYVKDPTNNGAGKPSK